MDNLFPDFINLEMSGRSGAWLKLSDAERETAEMIDAAVDERGKLPDNQVKLSPTDEYMVAAVLDTEPPDMKAALRRLMNVLDGITLDAIKGGDDEIDPVL